MGSGGPRTVGSTPLGVVGIGRRRPGAGFGPRRTHGLRSKPVRVGGIGPARGGSGLRARSDSPGRTPGHDRRRFASMDSDRRRAQAALRLRVSRASINTGRPKGDRIGSRRERPSVSEDLKGFDGSPLRPKQGAARRPPGPGTAGRRPGAPAAPRGAGLLSQGRSRLRPIPGVVPRDRGRREAPGPPFRPAAGEQRRQADNRVLQAPMSGARVSGPRVSGPRVSGPRVSGPRISGPSRAPIPGARDGSQCQAPMSGT